MFNRLFAPETDAGTGAPADTAAPIVADTADTAAPVVAEVSMDDTIKAEYDRITKGDTRERGLDGKFIAKTPSDPIDAVDAEPVVVDEPVVTVNTNPDNLEFTDNAGVKHAVDISQAPHSFRAEAKAAYEALPETMRREIHKREHDFHNGVAQYKGAANYALSIGSEFKPYEALIRSQNHTHQALTKDFLNTHYILSTGNAQQKAAHVIEGAAKYGLTVEDLKAALGSVQSNSGEQLHPEFLKLRQEQQEFRQKFAEMDRARTAAEEAAVQADIQRFSSDGKHEHFAHVAVEMGALMSAGRAVDMQDAYDKAIWANPEVRAKVQAKQAEAAAKATAEKAAAARRASSTNVTARGKPPAVAPTGSMEDTIRSTLHKLQGGA